MGVSWVALGVEFAVVAAAVADSVVAGAASIAAVRASGARSDRYGRRRFIGCKDSGQAAVEPHSNGRVYAAFIWANIVQAERKCQIYFCVYNRKNQIAKFQKPNREMRFGQLEKRNRIFDTRNSRTKVVQTFDKSPRISHNLRII
jgi:hypothetical protein